MLSLPSFLCACVCVANDCNQSNQERFLPQTFLVWIYSDFKVSLFFLPGYTHAAKSFHVETSRLRRASSQISEKATQGDFARSLLVVSATLILAQTGLEMREQGLLRHCVRSIVYMHITAQMSRFGLIFKCV